MIFLRQSYNVKPPRWGSFADVQYAIRVNSEKIYDCDPDDDILVMPLFWGLPCLDYSGKWNDGVNHGATYKDGSLSFDGDNDWIETSNFYNITATSELTVLVQLKTSHVTDQPGSGIVDKRGRGALGTNAGWTLYIIANDLDFVLDDGASGVVNNIDDVIVSSVLHHIVSVVNRNSDTIKTYIAGIERYSDSIAGIGDCSNTKTIKIANRDGTYIRNFFNGFMAEVRISNVARTADQIALFHALPYGLYQPVIRPIYSFITGIPVFMHHYNQMRAA